MSQVSSDTGTASYSYNNSHWQDLLTAYKGNSIYYEGQKTASGSYSASTKPLSGNPITWYNGSSYTDLTWAQGRRLMSLKKGSTAVSYTYDMEGIRSSKTVDGVTHHYVTQNGKIVRESYDNVVLDFIYDANGNPFALSFSKNGGSGFSAFYYLLNAQGDVIGLINGSGELVVSYTYDAWGNILSMENYILSPNNKDLHEVNPLRYRGYYYDTETGWYYLQSRYYDPAVGRFINADGYVSTGAGFLGYNMFGYCASNPVNNVDPTGNCYYNNRGQWVHEYWEFTPGYVRKPDPGTLYNSSDEAAIAFARNTYAKTEHIYFEYGSKIFAFDYQGTLKYGYTEPQMGNPHSVMLTTIPIPAGSQFIATAHTHPNGNTFSSGDRSNADYRGRNSYVIGPNHYLLRYNCAFGLYNYGYVSEVASIAPISLSAAEKNALVAEASLLWDEHIATNCAWNCAQKQWPMQ